MNLQDKKDVRKAILKQRDNIGIDIKEKWDNEIFLKLIRSEAYKRAKVIFSFVSFKSEVDTHRIIRHALNDSKMIYVPKVNIKEKEMEIFKIGSLEELKEGYYGILEPQDNSPTANINEIDLILMPGAAFDKQGGRVGYGGGFYDRFLERMNKKTDKVALAYDFQVLDKVPVEKFDIKVDEIITDKQYIMIQK